MLTRTSCAIDLQRVGDSSAVRWEGSKLIGAGGFKLALRGSDPDWRENWRSHGDTLLARARDAQEPILFVIDEFPDMLINLSRADKGLLRGFLAWFRHPETEPDVGTGSLFAG